MAMHCKSPASNEFCISIVIGCLLLSLSSCYLGQNNSTESSGRKTPPAGDIVEEEAEIIGVSRKKIHQQMAQGSVVSRRDAWDALAEGAATSTEYMTLFYTRRSILKTHKASGDNQSEPDYWNREHLWPRSYGLKGTPADFDLHNLVPVDRTVNTSRGNKVFDMASSPHHECADCRVSSHAWEPPDEVKGDIARAMFYMDVRYESSTETEELNKSPDLSLTEIPDSSAALFGPVSILLKWHCEDEVSEAERVRQDTIFRFQGNRNVFVDSPEHVEEIYGFDCDAMPLTTTETLD
jgi:endonuclease I